MPNELLPCPLCQGEVKWHKSEVAGEGGNVYHTRNLRCHIRFESLSAEDDEELIAAWNTRPAQARIRVLEDALRLARPHLAHDNANCLRLLPTEQWSKERGNRDDHCDCYIATVDAALAGTAVAQDWTPITEQNMPTTRDVVSHFIAAPTRVDERKAGWTFEQWQETRWTHFKRNPPTPAPGAEPSR